MVFSVPVIACAVLLGAVPLLWLPVIPGVYTILLLLVTGLVVAGIFRRCRFAPYLVLYSLMLSWSLFSARQSINLFDKLGQKPLSAQVKITRSDGDKNHEIQMVNINQRYLFPAPGAVLNGSVLPEPVCEGQVWLMTLRLRPVHGQLNEGLFDSQRYALSRQLPLRGRVIKATRLTERCNLRGAWLRQAKEATQHLAWQGVMIALGFGERVAVSAEVKQIMRDTGTAHLMAISGLHIALAGGVGWLFARGGQRCFPASRIGYRFPLLMSLGLAAFYTWLSGMDPPAVRTLVGMGIWAVLRLSGRQWSSWDVLLCCVAGIVFSEPLSILSDSLWLSALAVAGLIFWYQWVPLPRLAMGRYLKPAVNLLYLQTGVTLLLAPLQLALFHGLSTTSLVANLFAVPVITFISVPLILAGMVLGLWPVAGTALWYLADRSLAGVFAFLAALPAGWIALDSRFIGLSFIAWWIVVLWRCGLWRSSPVLVVIILLSMVLPFWRKPASERWAVHMLDVGHGLAMVVEKNGKALLYDSGPAWPGGDAARYVIIPWLKWHNLTPQQIIISHEHLDHIGGLNSLRQEWPEIKIRSSLREREHEPCFRGQQWRWQGLQFNVLWPPEESRAKGNNRSCVVMLSDGSFRALFTGDLEGGAEIEMLKNQWHQVRADVVQVPHHGSKTSSRFPLLRAVAGTAALASTSRYNVWRLPAVSIIKRYRQQGYRWYDTAQSGQITIDINHGKWQIKGFREQILPRWYHQWFGVPRDNR